MAEEETALLVESPAMEELDRDGDGHLDDRNCVRRDHESQAARGQRTQDRDDTDSRHSAGVSWSTVNSSPSDEDRAGAQLATDRSAAKTPAELRVDPTDGKEYSLQSFLDFYRPDGQGRWHAVAVFNDKGVDVLVRKPGDLGDLVYCKCCPIWPWDHRGMWKNPFLRERGRDLDSRFRLLADNSPRDGRGS